jgi:geranylgeranyl diphosphate synthase type II
VSTATGFDGYLQTRRRQIEAALDVSLPVPPTCPPLIAEAMRYSLLAGGKRLRPVLTLAAAEAVAGSEAVVTAMPAACAIELIHTYSLIHDDLPAMDDDDLRRGRPTAHVVYGDGMAILAGDALLTQAFVVLGQIDGDGSADQERRRLRVIARVAEAAGATGMVGGQVLDLSATGSATTDSPGSRDALREIHERKTGALIGAAAGSGAILAGASEAEIDAVDRYAAHLGLAFQIVDDILDVEGSADHLGKTAGKDAAAEKPTYPSLYGLDQSRRLADDTVAAALAALDAARLGGWLGAVAQWVVARKH